MKFNGELKEGVFVRRYKRFLVDVRLPSGDIVTMHCPNTGSMKNCGEPGSQVWFSRSDNPKRKYAHTWELVRLAEGHLACINTHQANGLVKEAVNKACLPELTGYQTVRTEVGYGLEGSRIDLLLENGLQAPRCYVEVKSVTLAMGKGLGLFPDAESARGAKHLRELMAVRALGHRAVLFFCVLHEGISEVRPADDIDPKYGALLREALAAGVEVIAYGVLISKIGMCISKRLSVVCPELGS